MKTNHLISTSPEQRFDHEELRAALRGLDAARLRCQKYKAMSKGMTTPLVEMIKERVAENFPAAVAQDINDDIEQGGDTLHIITVAIQTFREVLERLDSSKVLIEEGEEAVKTEAKKGLAERETITEAGITVERIIAKGYDAHKLWEYEPARQVTGLFKFSTNTEILKGAIAAGVIPEPVAENCKTLITADRPTITPRFKPGG